MTTSQVSSGRVADAGAGPDTATPSEDPIRRSPLVAALLARDAGGAGIARAVRFLEVGIVFAVLVGGVRAALSINGLNFDESFSLSAARLPLGDFVDLVHREGGNMVGYLVGLRILHAVPVIGNSHLTFQLLTTCAFAAGLLCLGRTLRHIAGAPVLVAATASLAALIALYTIAEARAYGFAFLVGAGLLWSLQETSSRARRVRLLTEVVGPLLHLFLLPPVIVAVVWDLVRSRDDGSTRRRRLIVASPLTSVAAVIALAVTNPRETSQVYWILPVGLRGSVKQLAGVFETLGPLRYRWTLKEQLLGGRLVYATAIVALVAASAIVEGVVILRRRRQPAISDHAALVSMAAVAGAFLLNWRDRGYLGWTFRYPLVIAPFAVYLITLMLRRAVLGSRRAAPALALVGLAGCALATTQGIADLSSRVTKHNPLFETGRRMIEDSRIVARSAKRTVVIGDGIAMLQYTENDLWDVAKAKGAQQPVFVPMSVHRYVNEFRIGVIRGQKRELVVLHAPSLAPRDTLIMYGDPNTCEWRLLDALVAQKKLLARASTRLIVRKNGVEVDAQTYDVVAAVSKDVRAVEGCMLDIT